jgi:hypothetical protein
MGWRVASPGSLLVHARRSGLEASTGTAVDRVVAKESAQWA